MVIETEGDIGDVIITLGIIRQIPNGPHTLVIERSGCTKFRTAEQSLVLLGMVKRLAESQSYIKECRIKVPGEHVDWHNGWFRNYGRTQGNSLWQEHVSHLITEVGIGHTFHPNDAWLDVEPDKRSEGMVVVARSPRYRNNQFPWAKVFKKYSGKILCVGVESEARELSDSFGPCEFHKTSDMMDVARLIKGSLLFIGNQSSPNAVAEGLKHNMLQEVSLQVPDCIYKRDNAQHCYNGRCTLPGLGFVDDEKVGPDSITKDVSRQIPPPGWWQYPGVQRTIQFEQIIKTASQLPCMEGKTKAEIEDMIIDHNVRRVPDFYENKSALHMVYMAMLRAGYTPQSGLPSL